MYRFILLTLLGLFPSFSAAADSVKIWTFQTRIADGTVNCMVSETGRGDESGHVHFLWTKPRNGAPYWKAAVGIIPEYDRIPVLSYYDRITDYQELTIGNRRFAARDRAFSSKEASEIISNLKRAQSFSYAFDGFVWRDRASLATGNFTQAIERCERTAT